MTLSLYGLRACDTCRAALKVLGAGGVAVTFIDVRAEPLSTQMLEKFYATLGDSLVNKRSTTWRGLDEKARRMPVVDLLSAHPTLMKRPVIERGDQLFLGWGKDVQSAFLPA